VEVETLNYFLEFQEYPITSENGTATIYNVSGWNTDDAKKTFKLHNIQYSIGNPGKISEVYCKFLGVKCCVEQRTCQGIKICKFASPSLLENTHTHVDFEDEIYKEVFESSELSSRELTLW
jgi:hypothetical protein